MMVRVIIGIGLGMALGALMGHFGKCTSGACPLTANPFRGAIYGGVLGLLFSFSFAGSTCALKGKESTHTVAPSAAASDTTLDAESKKSTVIHITTAAEFQRHVVDAEMPCLADFYSDRCGPCRMLAPTIEALARKYNGRAVICKVSLDAAPELARGRNIMGIPAVLFFDGGREVERLVGMQPQSVYEGVLEDMIAKREQAAKESTDANL